jgi:hypothetical protein
MNANRLLLTLILGSAATSAACFGGAYAVAAQHDSGSRDIVTREFAWDGSEHLYVGVPARVTYVQSEGESRVVARGPQRSVSTLTVTDGHLHDRLLRTGKPLEITITAPSIRKFELGGRSSLTIQSYHQDSMTVVTQGRARVEAAGSAREVRVNLQGHSAVNLAQLRTDAVHGDVAGVSDLVVAPLNSGVLNVRASASVVLLNKPAQLETNLFEAGRVIAAAPPVN